MNILVVDNDKDVLDVVRRMLADEGHNVDCCDDAQDATTRVDQQAYDFVFVDYKMPERDGVWFMKNARLPSSTKVLLMTAYINRDVINRMFSLGICGYIIKPFDPDEILRHLDYHASSA